MGYGEAPWHFEGRALYQLSLVRVEDVRSHSNLHVTPSLPLLTFPNLTSPAFTPLPQARKYVPPNLPLVNFFGWTLGGFYLARYTHSPVGPFNELVALGGLVWNFPTSCAWAARVYVNNGDARRHGLKHVGLPSRSASFKPVVVSHRYKGRRRRRGGGLDWWSGQPCDNSNSVVAVGQQQQSTVEITNIERKKGILTSILSPIMFLTRGITRSSTNKRDKSLSSPVAAIEIPRSSHHGSWAPTIKMGLPSFSGATPDHPGLLTYFLDLEARIRPIRPLKVEFPGTKKKEEEEEGEVMRNVFGGRPLLCLSFEDMKMDVQAPEEWKVSW